MKKLYAYYNNNKKKEAKLIDSDCIKTRNLDKS